MYRRFLDEVVSICNLINEQKEENEEIYLATDDKIASYVRVYDPSIKMPYGRGGKGASGKKAARWLHKQLVAEVPVIKKCKKTEMQLPGFSGSKQKEAAVYGNKRVLI